MAGAASDESSLDTTRSERGVWLLKVPKSISESWKNINPNEQIGVVTMCFDPLKGTGSPSTEFTIKLSNQGIVNGLPLEFNLNRASDFIPMQVFSEANQGKLSIEGRIDQKFDVQPKPGDEIYRKFLRNRDLNANKPKRQLQMVDTNDVTVSSVALPLFDSKKERPSLLKPVVPSRVQMSRESLESLVFELFEKEEFWGMKQLMAATRQSQLMLKQVLGEVCVYHKRGPRQGLYQLKEEYRKVKPQTDEKPSA